MLTPLSILGLRPDMVTATTPAAQSATPSAMAGALRRIRVTNASMRLNGPLAISLVAGVVLRTKE